MSSSESTDPIQKLTLSYHNSVKGYQQQLVKLRNLVDQVISERNLEIDAVVQAKFEVLNRENEALKKCAADQMNEISRLDAKAQSDLNAQKARFIEVSNKQKEVFLKQKQKLEQAANLVNFLTAKKEELETLVAAEKMKNEKLAKEYEKEHVKLEGSLKSYENMGNFSDAEKQKRELERKLFNEQENVIDLRKQVEQLKKKIESFQQVEESKSKMHVYVKYEGDHPDIGEYAYAEILGVVNPQYQWYRSFCGSQFTAISNADEPKYRVCADDVGACLKVEVTSSEGAKISAESTAVQITKELTGKIQEFLNSKKPIDFAVTPTISEGGKVERFIQLNREKVKVRDAKKTLEKRSYCEYTKISLAYDSGVDFELILGLDKSLCFKFTAESFEFRDLIALSLRAFNYVVQNPVKDKDQDEKYLSFIITEGSKAASREDVESLLAFKRQSNANLLNLRKNSVSKTMDAATGIRAQLETKRNEVIIGSDGIERDADGFIIIKQGNRKFSDQGAADSDEEDKKEKAAAAIVIRPADQAVVASSDELKKFSIELPSPLNVGKIRAPVSNASGRSRKGMKKKKSSDAAASPNMDKKESYSSSIKTAELFYSDDKDPGLQYSDED